MSVGTTCYSMPAHFFFSTTACRKHPPNAACGAGSLGASLIPSPLTDGLCGLSGIAHGLMAVSALEIMRSTDRSLQNAGMICFITVVLKSIYEAFTVTIAFGFLHFGSIGNAVPICHAGGVLGGILGGLITHSLSQQPKTTKIMEK